MLQPSAQETYLMLRSLGQAIEILLIEDNPSDIRLTQEALKESKLKNILHVVEDGEEALAYLYQHPPYGQAPKPDLILLDLNLPNLDGREVLGQIKQDPALNHIPVVVLTTSDAVEDIMKSYQLYANCYITKPIDLEQFVKVVNAIEDFWLTIVKLPRP